MENGEVDFTRILDVTRDVRIYNGVLSGPIVKICKIRIAAGDI